MWLDEASEELGWPSRSNITDPKGGGPGHYALLVREKIGKSLARKFQMPADELTTGILSADPSADSVEAPLAVVIQFSKHVQDDVLRWAQRLCWNFSRAAVLVTIEPTRVQRRS